MKEETCPICRENECDFETRCRHFFHKDCLEAAFKNHYNLTCPYCTKQISFNRDVEKVFQDPLKLSEKASSIYLSEELLAEIRIYAIKNNNLDALKKTISLGLGINAEKVLCFTRECKKWSL